MTRAEWQAQIDRAPKDLYVDGQWRAGSGGDRFDVDDPATEHALCDVADAQAGDAVAALDAAVAVQQEWADTPPRERGESCAGAWQLMTDRADDLALLMTLEMGKSLTESRAEVAYASEFFRWFSEEAVRIDGRWSRNPAKSGERMVTMKQPVGPCLLITP